VIKYAETVKKILNTLTWRTEFVVYPETCGHVEADELYDLMQEYKNAAKQAVEQIKAIIDICDI